MLSDEFEFIRTLVYRHSRINLTPDKRELVAVRLGRRLRATRLSTIGEYCELLQAPGTDSELCALIDAISTNYTFFFREKVHFDFIRRVVVPEYRKKANNNRTSRLNAWSAACSSGEEPYTLAMTLSEAIPHGEGTWHIEATDVSYSILEKAKAGIYSSQNLEGVPADYAKTYFQRGVGAQDGNYRIKPALRKLVNFQQLNLLDSFLPFKESFDIIFCRNVMIYFDYATQSELVSKLTSMLSPGGYLFVGISESLSAINHGLKAVDSSVYQKPSEPGSP